MSGRKGQNSLGATDCCNLFRGFPPIQIPQRHTMVHSNHTGEICHGVAIVLLRNPAAPASKENVRPEFALHEPGRWRKPGRPPWRPPNPDMPGECSVLPLWATAPLEDEAAFPAAHLATSGPPIPARSTPDRPISWDGAQVGRLISGRGRVEPAHTAPTARRGRPLQTRAAGG